jgi:hypothetical protein
LVRIVVAVLMSSCQVSEKPKIGPHSSHTSTITQAVTNATGMPIQWPTQLEKRVKRSFIAWRAASTHARWQSK